MLRAPEAEALYEGIAQKGFGVSILDGSPVPLGSTATYETAGVSKTLWGRWKSLDSHRARNPMDQKSNTKQKNTNDNQQPSGDKRLGKEDLDYGELRYYLRACM
jgi:hypothetical protein